MKPTNKLTFILFFAIIISIHAQQQVSCNGVLMHSNLEIAEAQISREKIMLKLHEIDMTKHQIDNCSDCPTTKSLILDVDFQKGFNFPITERDSVYITVTHLQKNVSENTHNLAQVNKIDSARNVSEEMQMNSQAELIKTKGQEIAKLMQEGKISAEDAQKQLLALTEPYLDKVDNSAIAKTNSKEFNEIETFSILFFNDDTNTETEAFSGYLYIKEFNEKRFVGEFRGEDIEQCVEKRLASSEKEKTKCTAIQSQYLPDTKVLREGSGSMTINVMIKDFLDNR